MSYTRLKAARAGSLSPRANSTRSAGYNSVMNIVLNGKPRTLEGISSVAELITDLGYTGKRIAVERNGEIVPRSEYAQTRLQNDDQLEIVAAVGGG